VDFGSANRKLKLHQFNIAGKEQLENKLPLRTSMKSVELFAGAGGLGMGISNAGFEPVAVVEWDRWCCDTLRQNRAGKNSALSKWPVPTEGDVRSVDFRKFESKVDLVSGGPPCQPFSLGGKHGAHEDRRDMWSEAVRAVREIKPSAFIFENVKGLTRAAFANYFSYISLQLSYPEICVSAEESWEGHRARLERHHTGSKVDAGLSYRVVSRVLNAANYGVPQKRERVVFVGFRSDLGIEWSFPQATHSREALVWDQGFRGSYWGRHHLPNEVRKAVATFSNSEALMLDQPLTKPWRTVRDAISGLPDPETDPVGSRKFGHHFFQGGARTYAGHSGSPLDLPAKTLKAGVHGVPGGENMLVRLDGSVRYFSVRESARLQTFPDNFAFHGSWTESMRQLGNAVPVTLASLIAENVRSRLETFRALGMVN
jgi:DNA (cytosine-5)-methyltransferase 1